MRDARTPRFGVLPFSRIAARARPVRDSGGRLALALAGLLLLAAAAVAQDEQVLYEVQSRYQLITVRDTADGRRQLIFDGRFDGSDAIQSEMDLADPDRLMLSYARHIMSALPLVRAPRRLLVVGLGGACIQRYLYRLLPEARIETVEIDPEIRTVAAKYFFFKEDARQIVHLADGRAFMDASKEKYDIIFLDAFSATSIPHHLTTLDFLQAVRGRLAPGGIVAANLWDGSVDYWDMVKTYDSAFRELHVVRCAGSGNSIVVASAENVGLTVQAWVDRAAAFEKAFATGLDLPQLIQRGAWEKTEIPESARIRK